MVFALWLVALGAAGCNLGGVTHPYRCVQREPQVISFQHLQRFHNFITVGERILCHSLDTPVRLGCPVSTVWECRF